MAAKHYYETAANLGDTDAMNEVAWCYLEGFGCKKDKVSFPSISPLQGIMDLTGRDPRRHLSAPISFLSMTAQAERVLRHA